VAAALTGHIIGSARNGSIPVDFRRTLGAARGESLRAITDSLHQRGMIHYGEAHEYIERSLAMGWTSSATMTSDGAMWAPGSPFISQAQGDADLRGIRLRGALYGQNLVAAESLTTMGHRCSLCVFHLKT